MEIVSVDPMVPPVEVIVTDVAERLVEIPSVAEMLAESVMGPAKPFSPIRLMVEVPVVPAVIEREDGGGEVLKPGIGTGTVKLKLCVRGPVGPGTVVMQGPGGV